MTTYRIYCINVDHITGVTVVDCENDDAARRHATDILAQCGHQAAEVWVGERMVCRVERRSAGSGAVQRAKPTGGGSSSCARIRRSVAAV